MKKRRADKPGGSGKNANIIVRASVLEKTSFRDAASLAGQSLSVWIRDRLRRAARQELESGSKPVAFLQG
jgi:hypothetical protein